MTKSDVKYIQSLVHKKHRLEEGLFVVEGVKMVDELLIDYPERIKTLYATRNWINAHEKFTKSHFPIVEVDEKDLERITFLQTPNEVLALVSLPEEDQGPLSDTGIILVLDQLQDPGNLGTIIRTADWFGVKKIFCSPDTCDAYAPKVVQSSMGSLMRMDIKYIELESFLASVNGLSIYSAELSGRSVFEVNFNEPLVLVIGNESRGVSASISDLANEKIMIPRFGDTESLNASIATGIILSHIKRGII